jgi:hypothetical protein
MTQTERDELKRERWPKWTAEEVGDAYLVVARMAHSMYGGTPMECYRELCIDFQCENLQLKTQIAAIKSCPANECGYEARAAKAEADNQRMRELPTRIRKGIDDCEYECSDITKLIEPFLAEPKGQV